MADEECEIEYLDEDEDIIQQFVQTAPIIENKPTLKPIIRSADSHDDPEENVGAFLVEKKSRDSKRKIKSEDDSDYDPSGDNAEPDSDYDPAEDQRQIAKKRKKNTRNTQHNKSASFNSSSLSQEKVIKSVENKLAVTNKFDLQIRRKKGIRIPDFEDPLCLPVKAVCNNSLDIQRMKAWNRICLEHYKKNQEPFRPFDDHVISSSRTAIFRRGRNKTTGQLHTTLWNKMLVEDSNGKQKSEVHNYTLPLFREKVVLKPFVMAKNTPRHFSHKHEVLLTKESNRDEECLVAYSPGDSVTAVYKEVKQYDTELAETEDKPPRLVMKEATCNKICAPCYQTSWRGVRKRENSSISCSVCSRTFVSVYNLLAHLRAHHNNEEVRKHRAALARSLATVVDYHYRCRICQESFLSIKLLIKHVAKHQGKEIFHCEIGNHVAK